MLTTICYLKNQTFTWKIKLELLDSIIFSHEIGFWEPKTAIFFAAHAVRASAQ